jgi:hypothetical protein
MKELIFVGINSYLPYWTLLLYQPEKYISGHPGPDKKKRTHAKVTMLSSGRMIPMSLNFEAIQGIGSLHTIIWLHEDMP